MVLFDCLGVFRLSDQDSAFGTTGQVELNQLVSRNLLIDVPGKLKVGVVAPSYISYAHYQNQQLVSRRHGVRAAARIQAESQNGDYSLRVVLRCQGRDISEPSFLSLKHSTHDDLVSISYKLDGDFLFEIREATPASFVFSVLDGADEIAFGEVATEVFPPNLWAMRDEEGGAAAGLLLSTFVRPRDPSLDPILTKARQLKGTYSDSHGNKLEPNTKGYQGDDDELMAEVRALYEAVQTMGIHYSNPASSLDWTIGQLIRTNQEIVEAKAATCLDSTILFASLLENISVRPVIAWVPGHAFVGFWTTSGAPYSFAGAVVPAEEAIGMMAREKPRLVFVETTTMCESPNQLSFEQAVSAASGKLLGSLSRVENAEQRAIELERQGIEIDSEAMSHLLRQQENNWRLIDISKSRELGYRPMATKIKNADGTSSLVEYSIDRAPLDLNISVDVAKVGLGLDNSPARVKYWKSQLLDLTFNNPLLNMGRRSSQLKLFVPKGRLGAIEDYLQQNKGELKLIPGIVSNGEYFGSPTLRQDGSTPPEFQGQLEGKFLTEQTLLFEGPRKVSKEEEPLRKLAVSKVRNLSRASKTSIDETGLNNLYMTFGSLRWKRKDANGVMGDYTVSPLILLPVTLRPIDRGRVWAVSLDDSNDVATNETLALKLFQDWGISIPALTAPAEDAAGIDIPGLLEAVRIAIDEAKQTSWFVQEDATIGTYDFSTFHMWKDLNDNWEKLSEAPLVKHLIETDGTAAYVDPMATDSEITEEELDRELSKVPVPSDGTQLRAVIRSLRGESFIIQGPPGTGKSQTITNLLARNLQEGKKVLFMSEKPAALEVVKDRLDEIRLGNFVLDLHSKNTSADSIRGQLLAALDASPKVDTVGIETEMFDFDVATKALTRYPERLHRVNETHGHSVYSVRDTLLKLPSTESLKLSRSCLNHFHGETLLQFKSNMENIQDVGEQAGTASQNPWSFSNVYDGINTQLRDALVPMVIKLVSLARSVVSDPQASEALSKVKLPADLEAIAALPADVPTADDLQLLTQLESKQKLSNHIELLKLLQLKLSPGNTANSNFGKIPIADLEAEYRVAQDAKLFKKKKMDALAGKVTVYWSGKVTSEGLGALLQDARELFDLGKRVAESSLGIPALGMVESSTLFADQVISTRLEKAEALAQLSTAFSSGQDSSLGKVLGLENSARQTLVGLTVALLDLFGLLRADVNSISLWLAGKNFGERLGEVLTKWEEAAQDGQFNALSRWGSLIELIWELRQSEQIEAYNQVLSGQIPFTDAPRAFDRARLSLLLDKLIDEHELLNFNPATQNANITKLRKTAEALRVYNRDTISSSVVKARTFDPTAVAGRAGALRSEINKQRGKLPVRQLMKKYWETITEITPCVAASPDSVARFLDVNLAHFDLIVFDEASQLRVPNSIGALGRGKAAVIVGDSKQMPPTNFFASASSEDEDDDEFELGQPDVESILTMAEFSKLPSVMLKWHYRSQDEALIAFSNANYYQNELASFPSPSKKEGDERAVIFELVEGAEYIRGKRKIEIQPESVESDVVQEIEYQESNTNAKEAQAVVDRIILLHKQYGPSLNLGVVTMNESQRKKIVNLLEAQADEGLRELLDSKKTPSDYIFIRPLEKVQGDERDIIIMSVGFAAVPDPKVEGGLKLPLNFGPLTKAGSEKRLNVAVTRARKRVLVFCSFDPALMKLSDTSSEGMKGLKEYLTFAKSSTNELAGLSQSSFEEPDRHRIDVARGIASLGYNVVQNVGLSNFKVDVAVEHPDHPGRYLLAILLDGPNWRQRPAANDRDVLPVGILEKNMGWKAVERIWMPVWLKDPDGEKARIHNLLQKLLDEKDAPQEKQAIVSLADLPSIDDLLSSTQVELNPTGALTVDKGAVGINIDDIEPFAEVPPRLVTDDKSMLQYTDHPEIKRVISECIVILTNLEGPVHPDRAVNHIAKCFGLSHVQTARSAAILSSIPRARFTRDDEGFIYPDGLTISSFKSWRRANKGAPREISMISQTELGNAMRDLCERTHGLEKEELLRQTMLAFGPKTLSAPIRKRLEQALAFTTTRGLITLEGEHYVPKGE